MIQENAIQELAAAYAAAFVSNQAEQVLACMTEDFVAITPDKPPVVGKAATRAAILGDFQQMRVLDLHFQPEEIFAEGSWGFARGSSRGQVQAGGQKIELRGKFLWILRKQADGWKVARDSAFGDV